MTRHSAIAVLSIAVPFTSSDVQAARKRRLKDCHPDRYQHLSIVEQEAMLEEAKKVNRAADLLLRELGVEPPEHPDDATSGGLSEAHRASLYERAQALRTAGDFRGAIALLLECLSGLTDRWEVSKINCELAELSWEMGRQEASTDSRRNSVRCLLSAGAATPELMGDAKYLSVLASRAYDTNAWGVVLRTAHGMRLLAHASMNPYLMELAEFYQGAYGFGKVCAIMTGTDWDP